MNERYIILYYTPDGDVKVQAVIKDETIWLTQKGIAELFNVGVPAVSNPASPMPRKKPRSLKNTRNSRKYKR